MPISLAVIGTAGRKDDGPKLSHDKFIEMSGKVATLLFKLAGQGHQVHTLVSGGAAWADHVAVDLFLKHTADNLVLHLPAPYDFDKAQFTDTGVVDFRSNPGGTANYYHRKFLPDSLAQLGKALQTPKCAQTVSAGLFERNGRVAMADAIVALTFGSERKLKDGGTADTFRKYLQLHNNSNRLAFHIDLNTMLCWPLAEV